MVIQLGVVNSDLNPEQALAVGEAVAALEAFLIAPNESATEKNNALQRAAGKARKSVLNIQPKPKKEKK